MNATRFAALFVLGLAACEEESVLPPARPDVTPPERIEDLSVEARDGFGVVLGWTAPGDDGAEGQPSAYSVRYARVAITEAGWDSSLVVASPPSPQRAGAREALILSPLGEGWWFFAVKAADEVPNWSALSNVATVRVSAAPDTIPPGPISDLAADSASANSITLLWTAPGDDGTEGRASVYDLRYALTTITEKTWADAIEVDGEPAPDSAGTGTSIIVEDLASGTT